MKTKNFDKYIRCFLYAVIATVTYKIIDNYGYFFGFLGKIAKILMPFLYGFAFAYVLNPIVKLLNKKMKRGWAIALTYIVLISMLMVGITYTMPKVIENVNTIIESTPSYLEQVQNYGQTIKELYGDDGVAIAESIMQQLNSIISSVDGLAENIFENSVSSIIDVTSKVFNLILGFIISVYILKEKAILEERFNTMLEIILSKRRAEYIIDVISTYNKMIGAYIGIKAIDSTIIGIIAMIGMKILGIQNYILLSVLVGITNMIPYIGPFTGEVISFTITAMFMSPAKAVMVLGLLLCVQMFDCYVLEPMLVGKRLQISPLGVLVSLALMGMFFGPIGMLLASPTYATLDLYYDKMIEKYKSKKRNEEKAE